MAEITITEQNFEQEVLQSDIPVLVDFWASWCGPCKMLAPIVAETAEKYAGRVKVGKINVDEQPGLADRYRISAIPTLILFKNGKDADSSVGLVSAEQIEAMLR